MGRSWGWHGKTVPLVLESCTHEQHRENRSAATQVARTRAAPREWLPRPCELSRGHRVIRECVPAAAGSKLHAHPRGTGSGQWAVRSDQHCSAAEEAVRPEPHVDESPWVPSAGHWTRKER